MCCRNRSRTSRSPCAAPPPRRRCQPLLVTLGQYAYKKYQERKDSRAALPALEDQRTSGVERRSSPPSHILEQAANAEVVEKIGGMKEALSSPPPPRYEDVVASDDDGSRWSSSSEQTDSLFDDHEHELKKETIGESAGMEGKDLTKWQQKRAERMARKAEKAARRTDRAAMGL